MSLNGIQIHIIYKQSNVRIREEFAAETDLVYWLSDAFLKYLHKNRGNVEKIFFFDYCQLCILS